MHAHWNCNDFFHAPDLPWIMDISLIFFLYYFYLGLKTSLVMKMYEEVYLYAAFLRCIQNKSTDGLEPFIHSHVFVWLCIYTEMVCCMFNTVLWLNSLCIRISRQITWHKVFKQTCCHNVFVPKMEDCNFSMDRKFGFSFICRAKWVMVTLANIYLGKHFNRNVKFYYS